MCFGEFSCGGQLLSSHPLIRTSDPGLAVEELSRCYNIERAHFETRAHPPIIIANRLRLGGVTLHYYSSDASATLEFIGAPGYVQFFPMSGEAEIRSANKALRIDRASTLVLRPQSHFTVFCRNWHAIFAIELSEPYLSRFSQFNKDGRNRNRDSVPICAPSGADAHAKIRSIAISLAMQFAGDGSADETIVDHLKQALAVAFLAQTWTGLSRALQPVSRAGESGDDCPLEDYMHANWDKPISVDDVAAACGVSVRSVFARFRQRHGATPMAYLRDLRLAQANRLLLEDGEISVTEVALKCGFASFGHFARRYREKFGELPSATGPRPRPNRPKV